MKKLSDTVLTFLLFSVIALICTFSSQARAGAQRGIKMCEEIIIPSLLPVLIICNIILKSRASEVIEALFGKAFIRLFKLPAAAAPAVILGLIGGYPTGCVLTLSLYKDKLINKACAKRIMRFNLCGGCAFIITAVGTVTYGSTKTGVLLFLCNLFSAFTVMLISGKSDNGMPPPEVKAIKSGFTEALTVSAEASVKAIAVMSAYIVLFSSLYSLIKPPEALAPLLEITNGICLSDTPLPLDYCAFFLSFGGLCIHFQLMGYLKEMGIKYAEFLTFRMLSSLISFAFMKLYLHFFEQDSEVFNNLSSSAHSFSSNGLALSLIMIVGCAVIVFDIENQKLKLI